jgi:hypothetical protein
LSCKTDSLANFNCSQYYSGTVTLTSELKGADLHQSLRVVATVTGGRVSCQVTGTEVGDFQGPGMVAVEHHSKPVISVTHQRASDYATLDGKDSYVSSDEANGTTGTDTITWALRRQ